MRKAWAICASFSAFLAVVFVLFGGMRLGYDVASVSFLAASGAILGAIGAPEIEPKVFRYPALWQMSFATIGCVLLAVAMDAPLEGYMLAVLVGLMLGYLAPFWIKYIQAP